MSLLLQRGLMRPTWRGISIPNTLPVRGLKEHMLLKSALSRLRGDKWRVRLKKGRDGFKRTADHVYWERHFSANPHILEERAAINRKFHDSVITPGESPRSVRHFMNTLTRRDKFIAGWALFACAGVILLYWFV